MSLAGVSAYETATGRTIGDGTLSNVLYGTSLATNTLPSALNSGYGSEGISEPRIYQVGENRPLKLTVITRARRIALAMSLFEKTAVGG